jgi:hypothetical protein
MLPPEIKGAPMPKNPPPPNCPNCGKPMHFLVTKIGRRFRCIQCDGADPSAMSETIAAVTSELK